MKRLDYNRRTKTASIGRKLLAKLESQRSRRKEDIDDLLEYVEKQANKLIDIGSDPVYVKNAHGVEIDWLVARNRMRHDDAELLQEALFEGQEDTDGDLLFVQRVFNYYVPRFADKHGKEFELAKEDPKIFLN